MVSKTLGKVDNPLRQARDVPVAYLVLILGGAAVGVYVGIQLGGPVGAAVGALVGAFIGALAAGCVKSLKIKLSADGTVEAEYETIFA